MAETMRHVDLFSGIGGFALAAHWAGYQTEVFCERDDFCRKVLAKRWPGVPVVGDIHDFDGRPYAGADLLTGGIPCQPYSCAGKQLGDGDDRALWPQMRRVITEARPHWVVVENVAGFIGMALDSVLADLEAEGYECGTVVLPACAVNAPHRRDRVWVVADASLPRLEEREKQPARPECQTAKRGGNAGGKRREPFTRLGGVADGLPGRLDGHFDAEPAIPRVATGIPNRAARLKAMGNAIVPQVAYQILKAIDAATLESCHG